MIMIKGITIKLYTDGIAENIENVLAGEPSSDGKSYTLAIPKGDSHEWTDKIVEFFGRKFRTVGFAEQGIEENIPLLWNKKIKAEFLNVNNSCTIFEKDTFRKHFFENVNFCDNRSSKAVSGGNQVTGDMNIHIYLGEQYQPKINDIIISGNCEFEFDTESQKSISESFKEFRKNYPDFATINSVSIKNSCKIPDYDITAR